MKFISLLECDVNGGALQHIVVNFDSVIYFEPAAPYMRNSDYFANEDGWLQYVDDPGFEVCVLHFWHGQDRFVNASATQIINLLKD